MEDLPGKFSEKIIVDEVEKRELMKTKMLAFYEGLDLKSGYSKEIVLTILSILFRFYNKMKQPFTLTKEESSLLLSILQTEDELKLQVLYINWLYPKIVNGRQDKLPSSSKASQQLQAAFSEGLFDHKNLEKINEDYENELIKLEDLKQYYFGLLHLEGALDWELTPSYESKQLINKLLSLKFINQSEE